MSGTPRFDRGPAARRRKWQRIWRSARYFLAIALIGAAWHVWNTPQLRGALGIPQEEGELFSAPFPLCDAPGYARNCAVDGDTFRVGDRRIRIQGIDAPEREGQCDAETRAARLASQALSQWLSAGPFRMLPEGTVPRDQYGRELQTVWRVSEDGSHEDLARTLIRQGHAGEYGRGGKPDWCR